MSLCLQHKASNERGQSRVARKEFVSSREQMQSCKLKLNSPLSRLCGSSREEGHISSALFARLLHATRWTWAVSVPLIPSAWTGEAAFLFPFLLLPPFSLSSVN